MKKTNRNMRLGMRENEREKENMREKIKNANMI
jgi:hypothetical protein